MKGTILLLEDDHDTRVVLRGTLEAEGFYVFSATNGADGLSMLKRIKRPDLILVDQNMPLLSGDDFLRAKNQDPELASIPAVIISAVPNRNAHAGISGYLPKPLNLHELLKMVRKYCPEETSPGLKVERVFLSLDPEIRPSDTPSVEVQDGLA